MVEYFFFVSETRIGDLQSQNGNRDSLIGDAERARSVAFSYLSFIHQNPCDRQQQDLDSSLCHPLGWSRKKDRILSFVKQAAKRRSPIFFTITHGKFASDVMTCLLRN